MFLNTSHLTKTWSIQSFTAHDLILWTDIYFGSLRKWWRQTSADAVVFAGSCSKTSGKRTEAAVASKFHTRSGLNLPDTLKNAAWRTLFRSLSQRRCLCACLGVDFDAACLQKRPSNKDGALVRICAACFRRARPASGSARLVLLQQVARSTATKIQI